MAESTDYQLGSIKSQVEQLFDMVHEMKEENKEAHRQVKLALHEVVQKVEDINSWRMKTAGMAAGIAALISLFIPQIATILKSFTE